MSIYAIPSEMSINKRGGSYLYALSCWNCCGGLLASHSISGWMLLQMGASGSHQPFPHPASLCFIFHGLHLYIPKCVPSSQPQSLLHPQQWESMRLRLRSWKQLFGLGQIKPRPLTGGCHWCELFPSPWPPSWHGCTSSQLRLGFKGSCHRGICCYNHLILLQKTFFGPNPIHTSHSSQSTVSN